MPRRPAPASSTSVSSACGSNEFSHLRPPRSRTQRRAPADRTRGQDLRSSLAGFDRFLEDSKTIDFRPPTIKVLATLGHTVDHLSFRPGATWSSRTTFRSCRMRAQRAATFIAVTRAGSTDRSRGSSTAPTTPGFSSDTTTGAAAWSEAAFVDLRRQRDAQFELPVLLLQSLPINIRAGHLPAPRPKGCVILNEPLDVPRDAM